MNGWRFIPFAAILCLLIACTDNSVEQIEVQVPVGVTVPEDMVYIPEGEFVYGHPEDPKTALGKKISLKAYLIDRYEVTRGAFHKFDAAYPAEEGKETFPVAWVDYDSARKYCEAQGKRLPGETEWEKAARGADGRKWPWKTFQEHPNNGFSGFIPERVNARPEWVSPYGVYGMGHNVWEWVADDYDYNGMPGADKGRYKVIRGGLYQTHLVIRFSATWARNYMDPAARYNFIGFRCARDVG